MHLNVHDPAPLRPSVSRFVALTGIIAVVARTYYRKALLALAGQLLHAAIFR